MAWCVRVRGCLLALSACCLAAARCCCAAAAGCACALPAPAACARLLHRCLASPLSGPSARSLVPGPSHPFMRSADSLIGTVHTLQAPPPVVPPFAAHPPRPRLARLTCPSRPWWQDGRMAGWQDGERMGAAQACLAFHVRAVGKVVAPDGNRAASQLSSSPALHLRLPLVAVIAVRRGKRAM